MDLGCFVLAVGDNPLLRCQRLHVAKRRPPALRDGGRGVKMVVTTSECKSKSKEVEIREVPVKRSLNSLVDSFQAFLGRGFYRKNFEEYGPIFSFTLFGTPTVAMKGFDAALHLLRDAESMGYVGSQAKWPRPFRELLTERSMSFLTPVEHAPVKKLMAPPFAKNAVSQQLVSIDRLASEWLEDLKEREGGIDMVFETRRLAFRIMLECMLGLDTTALDFDDLFDTFRILLDGMLSLGIDLPGTKFNRAIQARDKIQAFLVEAASERRSMLADLDPSKDEFPADSLSVIIGSRFEDGGCMSDDEIEAQLLLIMFAGHDTVAGALTRVVQEVFAPENVSLLEELQAEVQQMDVTGRISQVTTLEKMSTLSRTLKETYRRWPPVVVLFRAIDKDHIFNGFRLRKGSTAILHIEETNMDPNVFKDPTRFDPSRFLDESLPDPTIQTTFGAGMRACMGRHFATAILSITFIRLISLSIDSHDFKVHPLEDREKPPMKTTNVPDELLLDITRRSSVVNL